MHKYIAMLCHCADENLVGKMGNFFFYKERRKVFFFFPKPPQLEWTYFFLDCGYMNTFFLA